MGFRFRKTIRLLPGVRLNISKGGFSTSVGRPGATINIGKRGVRGTVGLPGSGLSYSDMIVKRGQGQERVITPQAIGHDAPDASGSGHRNLVIAALIVVAVIFALLFAAGLMSARQSTPLPSQRSITAPPVSLPISASAPLQKAGSTHVTTDANCRANPNSRAKVVATLSGNEELTVVSRQSGWARVTTASEDCWVASRLVQ